MAESQGGKEVYPAPPAGADWDRGAVVESSDHPIEAGSDDFEEDEFLETGWDATSAAASTAASSNVYRHEYEHGRRYHSYKHGRYPIPNDDEEQHRMDMKHVMMMEITVGSCALPNLSDPPPPTAGFANAAGRPPGREALLRTDRRSSAEDPRHGHRDRWEPPPPGLA